ncbi:MAG: YqaA family protein [Paracoccaceae bacterium]
MIALFISAFLAATLLPAQSELGLAYLLTQHPEDMVALISVASLGNTLGSVVNWAIGRGIVGFVQASDDPKKQSKWYKAAEDWYQRFGFWSLLASWMPLIGDPITLVAGVFKEPWWRFLLLVGIAKTARYVIVATLALQLA